MMVGCSSALSIKRVSQAITEKSSTRGNEWRRLRMDEDVRPVQVIRRDLSVGENPWNGISEASDPEMPTSKCTTREKAGIKPCSSVSAATTASGHQMRFLV